MGVTKPNTRPAVEPPKKNKRKKMTDRRKKAIKNRGNAKNKRRSDRHAKKGKKAARRLIDSVSDTKLSSTVNPTVTVGYSQVRSLCETEAPLCSDTDPCFIAVLCLLMLFL